jgi:hypothetical protein
VIKRVSVTMKPEFNLQEITQMKRVLLQRSFLKCRLKGLGGSLLCFACAALLSMSTGAFAEERWFLSVYGGQLSDTAFNEIVRFNTDFEDYYLAAVAVGKELWSFRETLALEAEGQAVQHFEGKKHQEFNALLTLRWLPFPWDRYLDTSIGLGNGISYATRDPEYEEKEADDNVTSQWLYYLMLEVVFAPPGESSWGVFTRVHHRSSVFGLIDGVFAASNYVCAGIRYTF